MGSGKVVHCKIEPYDVYIGRPSKWGNPFTEREGLTRAECIRAYEEFLRCSLLMKDLPELKGKVLGCWCAPRPCHGDVLVRLANEV